MQSMSDSVHHLLKTQIEALQLGDFYDVLDTEIRGRNGTVFIYAGLRHNASKLKSFEDIDIAWIEEAENVSKTSWDILIPTIRKERSQIIVSFNPGIYDGETYQRFVVHPPKDSVVVKTTYRDNPWLSDVIKKEIEECKELRPREYENIWEGNPLTTVEGAIYSEELQKAQDENRITHVPYDPTMPVQTFWDLGWADNTSVWFVQVIGHEFRIIDCYQNQFKKTAHYVQILQQKGYAYDRIYLPHDAKNESPNADRTWEQIIRESFRNADVTVLDNFPNAIKIGIEAVRNIFPLCLFDKDKCSDGLQALRHYHYKIDIENGKTTRLPEHDSSSHFSDALRVMAMSIQKDVRKKLSPAIVYNRDPYSI